MSAGRVVIGVGNELRRDDGFGPTVVRLLRNDRRLAAAGVRLLVTDGEPATILDAFDGVELAVVVDAVYGRAPVGTPLELAPEELATFAGPVSSHGMSLAETIALATAMGRLPHRLAVLAAVGGDFSHGIGLSAMLAEALASVTIRATHLLLETTLENATNQGGDACPARTIDRRFWSPTAPAMAAPRA
jgi:hydrogenase maturation protease